METDQPIEPSDRPTSLKVWAASLVALRETDEGAQVGHTAELIKAESEDAARDIGMSMSRKNWPEEGWQHSVALNEIALKLPEKSIGLPTIEIRIDR